MPGKSIIEFNQVSFSYNGNNVLKNVNAVINDKDFIWIVGPNGGGKTTLVKLMLGLLRPDHGEINILGENPVKARQKIGYMPQAVHLDPLFPATVLDIALMGRLRGNRVPGLYNRADRLAAQKALAEVGLENRAKDSFASLSGGQQRKLLIARALAGEPEILILDEPTANLDLKAEKELNEVLVKFTGQLTIVLVSHDPAFVSKSVKKVLCVNRTVAEHPTSEVDANFLGHFFGGDLRMVRHDKHLGNQQ